MLALYRVMELFGFDYYIYISTVRSEKAESRDTLEEPWGGCKASLLRFVPIMDVLRMPLAVGHCFRVARVYANYILNYPHGHVYDGYAIILPTPRCDLFYRYTFGGCLSILLLYLVLHLLVSTGLQRLCIEFKLIMLVLKGIQFNLMIIGNQTSIQERQRPNQRIT